VRFVSAFSVGLVATDPGDLARSRRRSRRSFFSLLPSTVVPSLVGGQVGPAINLDVDFGEDRHLALQAIPALRGLRVWERALEKNAHVRLNQHQFGLPGFAGHPGTDTPLPKHVHWAPIVL